jgi:preprotein translocase subunit SecD
MLDWKMWRWVITIFLAVGSIYVLVPSLVAKDEAGAPKLPEWWKGTLTERTISLGLDLQGGMHVDLEVDVEAAILNKLGKNGDAIRATLAERKVELAAPEIKDDKLVFTTTPEVEKQISEIVKDRFPDMESARGPQSTLAYEFSAKATRELKDQAVRQALETIRNRIDQFGVREADIVRKGDDRIVVQLPGIKDPQRALDLIQNTAQLEFRIVENSATSGQIEGWLKDVYAANPTLQTAPATNENVAKLNELLKDKLPAGTMVLFSRSGGKKVPVLVQAKAAMTGEYIREAQVKINTQYNDPYVGIEFDAEGADLFERVTGEYTNRQLAIVLDNIVKSAPNIKDRIAGGSAVIEGSFTMDEARDLAIALRSGALPAPVSIAEKRVVGPTLGKDSIQAGINSVLLGLGLVVLFMVAYYRISGFIANLALVLNVVVILAGLALFEATLTLPGIAGIVLTVGMSIDANIIIFERMREELRLGKTPRAALEAGYNKALWTIIDAHVTALVSSLVLFQFGTGPVKGFAVTLTLGIISSVYTAVVVSKMIFDKWTAGRGRNAISVGITVPQPAAASAKGK